MCTPPLIAQHFTVLFFQELGYLFLAAINCSFCCMLVLVSQLVVETVLSAKALLDGP